MKKLVLTIICTICVVFTTTLLFADGSRAITFWSYNYDKNTETMRTCLYIPKFSQPNHYRKLYCIKSYLDDYLKAEDSHYQVTE